MNIDTSFNVYTDTPKGRDPDSHSPTLRNYHKFLWSKKLPNGLPFKLDETIPMRLHHKSDLGEFVLSSDSIAHTYSNIKSTTDIVKKIDAEELEKFVSLCSTIGGYIIFPSERINNQMTINGARGVNKKIRDRFDLTLECIRRYYIKEDSPLKGTFERYKQFFNLFDSFQGYVDFFLLQDLVSNDYSSIKYLIPFHDFDSPALPCNMKEYITYKDNTIKFISQRNERILKSQQ